MANLIFYVDHGPLLCRVYKSAFLIYTYYDKFQNDRGEVQITYTDLNEHLGVASTTISKVNSLLKKLELIEEVGKKSPKMYKVLPVKLLTDDLRAEILKAAKIEEFEHKTSFRKKYLEDNIPAEYQQLLNQKTLKKAYKELGTLKKIKALCAYFQIDYYTFKLLFEKTGEDSFRSKFKALAAKIEVPKKKKQPKKDLGERELAKYLYDKLDSLGAKPIDKRWFMRNCTIGRSILANISLVDAKQVLDWGFEDKWWKDKIDDLNAIPKLHSRAKLQKTAKTLSRATKLPDTLSKTISQILDMNIETYEDAAFLKQSVLDGQEDSDILKAVSILEKAEIIPSGDQNLRFG